MISLAIFIYPKVKDKTKPILLDCFSPEILLLMMKICLKSHRQFELFNKHCMRVERTHLCESLYAHQSPVMLSVFDPFDLVCYQLQTHSDYIMVLACDWSIGMQDSQSRIIPSRKNIYIYVVSGFNKFKV